MDTTKCISDQDWESYSRGKLSVEALQLLELHASSCEICTDIKEGIDQMKDPSLLAEKVSFIRQDLDKKTKPEQKTVIAWWKWAAAALVVLSSAWLAWQWPRFSGQTEQPDIAIVHTPDTQPSVPEKKEKPAFEKDIEPIVQQASPKKTKAPEKKIPVSTESVAVSAKTEDITVSERTDGDASEQKASTVEETRKEQESPPPTLDRAVIATEPKEQVVSTKALSKELPSKKGKIILPSNQISNNQLNNNYSTQLDTFILQHATEQYERKAYDSCLLSLHPILQFSASPLYEDALLLEAKVYLARAEKRRAHHLLKKIVSMDGRLKNQAQELIDKK